MLKEEVKITENKESKGNKNEIQYRLNELRNNCNEVFGVGTHIFDGVTYNLDNSIKYTKTQIAKEIEKWKTKEVK